MLDNGTRSAINESFLLNVNKLLARSVQDVLKEFYAAGDKQSTIHKIFSKKSRAAAPKVVAPKPAKPLSSEKKRVVRSNSRGLMRQKPP